MFERLLQFVLTYVLDKLLALITRKWDEYKQDERKRDEIKQKVQKIKDAKTKEEIRSAIRDLSI